MNIQAYSPVQTAYTQYPQQNAYVRPTSGENTYNAFSTDFTNISSMLSHAGGGGFASYKLGAQMATDMKSIVGNGFKGAFTGLKNTAITGLKGAGYGALVSAGVSAVANGVGVATGKIDSSEAVGNVVSDTLTSTLGGLTGVTMGGITNIALTGIGVTGIFGTIAMVAAGAVGGVVGGQLGKKIASNF